MPVLWGVLFMCFCIYKLLSAPHCERRVQCPRHGAADILDCPRHGAADTPLQLAVALPRSCSLGTSRSLARTDHTAITNQLQPISLSPTTVLLSSV